MQNNNRYIIIGLNLLVMLLSLWLKPRFQTNDDIAMIYAYSGTSVFSEPTAVTAFSTKIWGSIMVFLYSHIPSGTEIYTIVFYGFIFLSSIIIHMRLFGRMEWNKPLLWLLFIPLLGFITLQFYLELQFTMMAGLLCFTGSLLFLSGKKNLEIIPGIGIFLFGSIIRPDIIPVMLVFVFSMTIISKILRSGKGFSYGYIVKRFSILLALFVTVFFTDQLIHTKSEKEFLDFNTFRVAIVDYNADESNSGVLPIHWDKVEVKLFKNWFYNDKILYNRDKAHRFASKEAGNANSGRVFDPDLMQFRQPLFNCMFLLMLVPILLTAEWKRTALMAALFLLLFLVLIVLLTVFFKTPPFRVSYVMFAVMAMMYLFLVLDENIPIRPASVRYLFPFIIVCFAFFGLINHLKHRNAGIEMAACNVSYDPEVIYIHWPVFPFEAINPFSVTTEERKKDNIVWLCSFSVHPAARTSFRNFSYTNLTSDIIGKEHLISFVLPSETEKWREFREAYCNFIAKHYRHIVYFEKVDDRLQCNGFGEYKLREHIESAPVGKASQM